MKKFEMPRPDLSELEDFKQITIHPDPKDGKKTAVIIFASIEIGNSYITKEYNALSKAYRAYWGSITLDERATTFQALSIARTAFARKMGYQPHKKDDTIWFFQGSNSDTHEPPRLA